MNKIFYLLIKDFKEYISWNNKIPIGKIPKTIAKEGAGENRIPFAHLANSVPVYLIFKKIIKKSRNKIQLLDVGCGTGRDISFVKSHFPNKNYNFYGIDYSKACINFAKEKYKKYGVKFNNFSGKVFPFKNQSFDYVVSSHVLEHIKKAEGPLYLKEIIRVTRKGGVIVIGTPNRKNCQNLFHPNPNDILKYRLILPHEHEYLYDEIIKLMVMHKKYFSNFQILETHNPYNRRLMINSINFIKPSGNLFRKPIFIFYNYLRNNKALQDFMAKFGTEIILKSMKINYEKLIYSTTIKPSSGKNDGDNFIVIVKK